MSSAATEVKKPPHRFKKGHKPPPGSGRPKGSRNKTTIAINDVAQGFMECIKSAMEAAGETVGKKYQVRKNSPEVQYMAWLAMERPEIFATFVARFLPNKVEVDLLARNHHTFDLSRIPSKDEVIEAIRGRGLPPPPNKIFENVDFRRDEVKNGEVIDVAPNEEDD